MVVSRDRVLLSGSRAILGSPGGEKRMPSPSSTGSTYTRISSTSPRCRHWPATSAPTILQVLAARGVQRGRDRIRDVTGEVRDVRVRRVRRTMGENEHGSRERVLRACCLVRFHPGAHVPGAPTDEHCASGRRDLRDVFRCHEVGDASGPPVHRVAGTGDEAIERHRPVHDHPSSAGIAHPVPPEMRLDAPTMRLRGPSAADLIIAPPPSCMTCPGRACRTSMETAPMSASRSSRMAPSTATSSLPSSAASPRSSLRRPEIVARRAHLGPPHGGTRRRLGSRRTREHERGARRRGSRSDRRTAGAEARRLSEHGLRPEGRSQRTIPRG